MDNQERNNRKTHYLKNKPTSELSANVIRVLMHDMDYVERLLFMAIISFTREGFIPGEQNLATAKWLVSLFNEDGYESFDSDIDYFAKIFAENHNRKDENGKIIREHVGSALYRVFCKRGEQRRKVAVKCLSKKLSEIKD